MGTRLPASSASADSLGPNAEVMYYLQEKRAWQADRGSAGNPTLDILRYTESGGMAYYLVEPSYSQTSGLSALPCYFEEEPEEYRPRFGSMVEDATCTFVLYDVPGGVTEQDIIQFESKEYAITNIWTDPASGRFEVLARKLDTGSVIKG